LLFSFNYAQRIPYWGRAEFMRVANLPIDVERTVQFDIALLKNDEPLTLSVTNEAHRTYFSGPSWMQIAAHLGMQAGKAFLLFLQELEKGNKIYLWYNVPQSP
jgi:hypothetical protein